MKKEVNHNQTLPQNHYNQTIINQAQSLGAAEIGFSDLALLPADKRMNFDRGITVIIKLSDGILNQIGAEPTQTYFNHYRSVNRLIDDICLRILLALEAQGYPSVAIPASQSVADPEEPFTGAFQHKTAAVLAGLGWIGRSALFIHQRYGPRVRLGTILTNAPLIAAEPITKSGCGSCRVCVSACPAMAIEGPLWKSGMPRNELYNAYACSQHMKEAYQHIGRGVVCGLCVVACPIGK